MEDALPQILFSIYRIEKLWNEAAQHFHLSPEMELQAFGQWCGDTSEAGFHNGHVMVLWFWEGRESMRFGAYI